MTNSYLSLDVSSVKLIYKINNLSDNNPEYRYLYIEIIYINITRGV